jgi:tetratricopeptide (TPR) repeat protein
VCRIKHRVNEFITLKLRKDITHIFVKRKRFMQCKSLFITLPDEDEAKDYDYIDSVDSAGEIMLKKYRREYIKRLDPRDFGIAPEEEFWGHCSNLDAWCEHEYDPRILHSNIAFPLLKKLYEAGDPVAKKRFKEAIEDRFLSGNMNVITYLLAEKYLDIFDQDELEGMIEELERNATGREEEVWDALGRGFFAAEKYELALKAFKSATYFNPIKSEMWKSLAATMYKLDDIEGCIDTMVRALEIQPNDSDAWFFLAAMYEKAENQPEAAKATRHARRLLDKHPDVILALNIFDL